MAARQVFFTRLLHSRGVCRIAPPRSVAAAITAVGDLISQTGWEGREFIDRQRLLACAALGYALDGAALQRWYALLHRLPPGSLWRRLCWHHAAFAPLAITAFLAGTTACDRRACSARERLAGAEELSGAHCKLLCARVGHRAVSAQPQGVAARFVTRNTRCVGPLPRALEQLVSIRNWVLAAWYFNRPALCELCELCELSQRRL